MLRFRISVLLLLGCASPLFAGLPSTATLEELQALVEKPHSPKLEMVELKIFPSIRKYRIEATVQLPGGEPKAINTEAAEKWVDGKYIVTTFQFPGAKEPTFMVVTYDDDSLCYRKWVFGKEEIAEKMVGTRIGDSRTLSWLAIPKVNPDLPIVVSQETHTDESSQWSELHLKGEKVIARIQGKAVAAE